MRWLKIFSANGVEKIVPVSLNDEERAMFAHSAKAVEDLLADCIKIDGSLG